MLNYFYNNSDNTKIDAAKLHNKQGLLPFGCLKYQKKNKKHKKAFTFAL